MFGFYGLKLMLNNGLCVCLWKLGEVGTRVAYGVGCSRRLCPLLGRCPVKNKFWYLLPLLFVGCDVVEPSLLAGSVEEISPGSFVNATVSILYEEGYTVDSVDQEAGLVTSHWRDESSFAGQNFLDRSRRTRISVVFDFYTKNVKVQMTKQKKEGDDPWRNDGLSENDRNRMQVILSRIQERSVAIGQGTALAENQ